MTGTNIVRAGITALLGLLAGAALAQPAKTVQIIVPFAPGGGQDILARSFSNELGAALGQTVIIDYKPGPGTGPLFVSKAGADNPVLLIAGASHTIVPLLSSKPPYDPIADFAPVAHIGTIGQVLLVNSQFPARNIGEFIALVRANPGKFNYASAGNGTTTHLGMAYLASAAGLDMTHVPFKSNAAPMTELLAERIHSLVLPNISALPYSKEPKLRLLAVTTAERNKFFPALPTMSEAGYPGFAYASWLGLLGAATLAPAIVERVNHEMGKLLTSAVILERMDKSGIEARALSPRAFGEVLRADRDQLAKIVKLAGATIN